MKLLFRLVLLSTACMVISCATPPTSNPWNYPNRDFDVALGAENDRFVASLQLCMEYANKTFADALRRYISGLPGSEAFVAKVLDDHKVTSWIRVDNTEGDLINGRMIGRHTIKGRFYAAGDKISFDKSNIVDWYLTYRDRPPEGNLIGKYILLKMDGLAPEKCDPSDIEFQRYRFFAMGYSFVPPGTEGWDIWGQSPDADMTMQQKDENLDEVNTLAISLYRVKANMPDEELIEAARNTGRYGDEEGVRYNVVKLEAGSYPHKQTRCARSQHIVEDNQALLSKSGNRGFMIRDVQVLICIHPANEEVALVMRYLHRHHPGKREPGFIGKADRVFESLAFRSK